MEFVPLTVCFSPIHGTMMVRTHDPRTNEYRAHIPSEMNASLPESSVSAAYYKYNL